MARIERESERKTKKQNNMSRSRHYELEKSEGEREPHLCKKESDQSGSMGRKV